MFRSSLLAALLLVGISTTLAAQQPTEEQRAAVRTACRSDFIANCSSVEPGTKAALMCLVGNEAELSPACRTAVNAITAKSAAPAHAPPPAAAEAPPPAAAPDGPAPQAPPKAAAQEPKGDQLSAVRQACTLNDFIAHCSWIKPDSPEILLCLKANVAALSPLCQAAVGSAQAAPTQPAAEAQPAEGVPPAEAAPPPTRRRPGVVHPHVAAPPSGPPPGEAQPSPEQVKAVRTACRSDFMARCHGVQPGGAEAVQCLQENSSRLSTSCRRAVAAIAGGAPPPGGESGGTAGGPPGAEAQPVEGAPPAEGAPPTTRARRPGVHPQAGAPPSGSPPGEAQQPSPEQVSAIRAACRGDFRAYCRGVQPGGAEALQCLQRSASQLAPSCRSAVAAIGGGAPPPGGESEGPGGAPPPGAGPAGAPPPGAGPAGAPPAGAAPIPPREAMFVLRACSADRYRLCGDVPPGGGRILMCLAENAANVSPGCASALAAARR